MHDQFELQLLAPHHRRDAKNQHRNSTTRVYVYANRDGDIAGFFTLSAHLLELTGLPDSLLKGRVRLPVPAILLGRLAIDHHYEGQGLGTMLLSYALRESYKSSQIVAAAFVVLDVADDASAHASELYRKCGFVTLPSNPKRMLLPIGEISRSL